MSQFEDWAFAKDDGSIEIVRRGPMDQKTAKAFGTWVLENSGGIAPAPEPPMSKSQARRINLQRGLNQDGEK